MRKTYDIVNEKNDQTLATGMFEEDADTILAALTAQVDAEDKDPTRCTASMTNIDGDTCRCLWNAGHEGDHEAAAGGNWNACFGWMGEPHRSDDGHKPHRQASTEALRGQLTAAEAERDDAIRRLGNSINRHNVDAEALKTKIAAMKQEIQRNWKADGRPSAYYVLPASFINEWFDA